MHARLLICKFEGCTLSVCTSAPLLHSSHPATSLCNNQVRPHACNDGFVGFSHRPRPVQFISMSTETHESSGGRQVSGGQAVGHHVDELVLRHQLRLRWQRPDGFQQHCTVRQRRLRKHRQPPLPVQRRPIRLGHVGSRLRAASCAEWQGAVPLFAGFSVHLPVPMRRLWELGMLPVAECSYTCVCVTRCAAGLHMIWYHASSGV